MPGRVLVGATGYRYGFNGKENDNEVKGSGNSYDFGARIYDPRIGRWLSLDPLQAKYPELSPYNFVANNPILFIDADGREIVLPDVTTQFGQNFQMDIYTLFTSKSARALLTYLNESSVKIITKDASSMFLTDEGDVKNSQTTGDYPDGDRADDGIVNIKYAQRENVKIAGTTAFSYLVLAHEFVHAKDIASGYFKDLKQQVKDGKIAITKGITETDIAEVRALIYANKIAMELGSKEIRTEYNGVKLTQEDGLTPIKDYGFDVTKGLFDGVEKPKENVKVVEPPKTN